MQFSSKSLNSLKTLVFIDANRDDSEYLVQGVKLGLEVHILDADQDSIEQITAPCQLNPHVSDKYLKI